MTAQSDLVFVATSDIAGLMRGKAFPAGDWEKRLDKGIGWTPTNVQITCFDTIAETPFGALGDLALVPDPATRFTLADPESPADFALGDIRNLDGTPWGFCTRSLARRALDTLHELCGATPLAAFEHEFMIRNLATRPGDAYALRGYRDARGWQGPFLEALEAAGCRVDSFMKEYGPAQYEIVIHPAQGLGAPDKAAVLRTVAGDVLRRHGAEPSFAPILDAEQVGNGVHLHLSFVDDAGDPMTHDAKDSHGMSRLTRHFIGGVLRHLHEILAILAPSEVSYLRLTPHRWSAAFNNLGYRDREAAVRICPVFSQDPDAVARAFNFEIRAMDAAASPHLAFAAVLFAGIEGVRGAIEPPAPTEEDLSLLSGDALAARGFNRLPQTLPEALDAFGGSPACRRWFGDDFVDLYVAHKRGEMAALEGLDWAEKCNRYAGVY